MGLGPERKNEAVVEELEERPIEPQRNRPASELRFGKPTPAMAFQPLPPASLATSQTLTEELRAGLWEVVQAVLFAAEDVSRAPSSGAGHVRLVPSLADLRALRSPTLRRVWAAPPISGAPERIPEDVASVLEGWFSLVEPSDVYAFVETVHDSLEPALQPRFVTAVNTVLERGLSDHRFVLRRLMPIASRSDIAAIERSLGACKAAHWAEVEAHLLAALAKLAEKPEPDPRGAIQAAARAVQQAALALTKEHYFDLEDALNELEAKGHIEKALKAAYAGLFDYVTDVARKTTSDDARLIVVMCAGFVTHLASRLG
jgi:hypothetical protein